MDAPGSPAHLTAMRAELLQWVPRAHTPLGFGWLDERGDIDSTRKTELWVTCRMTHVAALGVLADEPPRSEGPTKEELAALAGHGVASLLGPLHDATHGGWLASIDAEARPADGMKQAYGHAFVTLAAASAVTADVENARQLLDMALTISVERFLEPDTGRPVDAWDRSWSSTADYRGLNSTMHTVEAYLAAGAATGNDVWWERAGVIAAWVARLAANHENRLPEHFSSDWAPLLEHNRHRPADPFQPYGATIGHGFEWARLLVLVDAALGPAAPDGLVPVAIGLFDRAVQDGWAADGQDGFIYTTDWDGQPVVRARMHWVAAEALAAATVLHRRTRTQRFADLAATWWRYVELHLRDNVHGSWHHELDARNRPTATVWGGKPDVYHAYQAALTPRLPVAPSFAAALVAT